MNNSFDSIERLMEFGLSMAVANQMINTMNHAITNMQFSGQGTTLSQIPSKEQIYVVIDGNQAGPFDIDEINTLIDNNSLNKESLVWFTGLNSWKQAKDIPKILKLLLLKQK